MKYNKETRNTLNKAKNEEVDQREVAKTLKELAEAIELGGLVVDYYWDEMVETVETTGDEEKRTTWINFSIEGNFKNG